MNRENVLTKISDLGAYIVLIITQMPTLNIYIFLMAFPIFFLFPFLLEDFPGAFPTILEYFMTDLFNFESIAPLGKMLIILGFLISITGIINLAILKRSEGLVTSGIFKYIRHPQYLGFILFTLGLSSWAYILASITIGISWIELNMMKNVWYFQLFIYLGLARIEELSLHKRNEQYEIYYSSTAAFIPFLKIRKFELFFNGILFLIISVASFHNTPNYFI